MPKFILLSAAEQVANHLRERLLRKAWGDELPGVPMLAMELGVNHRTVITALVQLETEGLLVQQGVGRRRKIMLPKNLAPPPLRVGIMLYEKADKKLNYIVELMRQLQERGYRTFLSKNTLTSLQMDVKRVARSVSRTPANAWVVIAGSSEVLEWFSCQETPAFALFGRQSPVDIAGAGPRKSHAVSTAVKRLVELGHRRIVLLVREERRKPELGLFEKLFLEELQANGIEIGPYNLPDWEDNPEGFLRGLTSLFQHTPPTAVFTGDLDLFTATQQFLLHQGIRVPQDVSIVSSDPHSTFAWCNPTIAHVYYDSSIWTRDVMRWVNKVARGKEDRRQFISTADFIEGGTIGPVNKG